MHDMFAQDTEAKSPSLSRCMARKSVATAEVWDFSPCNNEMARVRGVPSTHPTRTPPNIFCLLSVIHEDSITY